MQKEDIQAAKKLIGEGYLTEAFEWIEAKLPRNTGATNDEFILLKSQFSQYQKKERMDMVEGKAELNQLIYRLISFLNALGRGETDEPLVLDATTIKPEVVQQSQARLYYQHHQELFQQFNTVNEQVNRYLSDPGNLEKQLAKIESKTKQLTTLQTLLQELTDLKTAEEAAFGDQVLIEQAQNKLNYIQQEMTLTEIAPQMEQTQQLLRRFSKRKWTKQIPYIAFGVVLIIIIFLIGLQVAKL